MPYADDSLRDQKLALRASLRQLRAALAPLLDSVAAQQASQKVAALLSPLPFLQRPRLAALYQPLPRELDPSAIGALLAQRGALLSCPRVVRFDPPEMAFHLATPGSAQRRSAIGVWEPSADEPLAPAPEVFLVPGLGFDRRGQRLGFGRGFYDAALRSCAAAWRIGLCYSFQLLHSVPHDEHDEPMDLIVTPEEIITTGARPGFAVVTQGGAA